MGDITDVDYMHTNVVYRDFETKSLCEYHDFHLKNDTSFYADVFENFRKM